MNDPILLCPVWSDYELIDSGGFEKLERFGSVVTARPEPQAIWNKSLSQQEWERRADARFARDGRSEDRGNWRLKPGTPEQWRVEYRYKSMTLCLRLGLTSFKHLGLFPEQAGNWNFIYDTVGELQDTLSEPVHLLNLFAYTGGASLAAAAAGAEVTHVDSVRQVVAWASENAKESRIENIRWVVDDALKYVRREVRRGKRYHGIILDPPAYGRGPEGEKWVLEENINEMLSLCAEILEPRNSFLVINLYSMGLSALLARTLTAQIV